LTLAEVAFRIDAPDQEAATKFILSKGSFVRILPVQTLRSESLVLRFPITY
jgi:hypothetical protein